METSKNPLNIPVAIIVAGFLIAIAVFLRGDGLPPAYEKQPAPQIAQEPTAITLRPFDAVRDHLRGNPEADIMFVEFSDTECPFCKRFHMTMLQVMNDYGKSGKVSWVYRQFPIVQLHSKAPKESEALECAATLGGNTAFWNYADKIFTLTNSNDSLDSAALPQIAKDVGLEVKAFENCLSSGQMTARVQEDIADGRAAGVEGTPHSVLVLKKPISDEARKNLLALMEPFRDGRGSLPTNVSTDGRRVSLNGAFPYSAVKAIIDILLK